MKSVPNNITKSLVIPVYKNEENIPSLLEALEKLSKLHENELEIVFVVDGSPDKSLEILGDRLPTEKFDSQLISHSRNFGSFVAIRTGMEKARGSFIAVMAADLQEPLELISDFFIALENNSADIIFGQRTDRKDKFTQKILAQTFWSLYRKFINPDIPDGGVDIFACNAQVKDTVLSIEEPNSSLVAQLFWVGYRRLFIPYQRKKREHGTSAWNMRKRLRYMLDSIFSYSDAPLLAMLWLGLFGVTVSIAISLITVIGYFYGWFHVPGYTTLLLGGAFLGSSILVTQGVLGCYLWRALENTKKRPVSIIQDIQKFDNSN